jgi:hypothetical protein
MNDPDFLRVMSGPLSFDEAYEVKNKQEKNMWNSDFYHEVMESYVELFELNSNLGDIQ